MSGFKSTLVAGVLFIIPLGLLGFVLFQVGLASLAVAEIIDQFVPIQTVAGVAAANIIAIVLLVVIIFLVGRLAQLSFLEHRVTRLDELFAESIPGYMVAKSMLTSATGEQGALEDMSPVVVKQPGGDRVGLEVERTDTLVIVYLPAGATFMSGKVIVADPDKVERLDVPAHVIIGQLQVMGRGLARHLDTKKANPGHSDESADAPWGGLS